MMLMVMWLHRKNTVAKYRSTKAFTNKYVYLHPPRYLTGSENIPIFGTVSPKLHERNSISPISDVWRALLPDPTLLSAEFTQGPRQNSGTSYSYKPCARSGQMINSFST